MSMGDRNRHTVYLGEDNEDLDNWIEMVVGDVYDSKSELFRKALEHFRDDKEEAISELMTDDGEDTVI